ncbi:MAG: GNAT family N-acetyltransferase [Thaumarchaeota archaeon]|nr:GNAT family N-acetyltransferase [Nitrososphaerota archaeon]
MEEVVIREAKGEDIEQAAELIVRMKRLNGEFDPLFKVVEDAQQRAVKYLDASMGTADKLVLVAARGKKVLGVLRAEVKDRLFYIPSKEGDITDFYILPEVRRKDVGREIIFQASQKLKSMGAEMIVAEFPAQNAIAVKFYGKRGFRALVDTFAKEERTEGQ